MNEITWSDCLGHRSRQPWLLLIEGDTIHSFTGKDIPGVVVVKGTDYSKNGKWSHNTFRLLVQNGVRHIAMHSGWETGTFAEGLARVLYKQTPDTWIELAGLLGVSVDSAKAFLVAHRPKQAEEMDARESAMEKLDDEAPPELEGEKMVVTFGSPTNRQIRAGWWSAPKGVCEGVTVELIDAEKDWAKGNVRIVGAEGVVLDVRQSFGMHGGSRTVSLIIYK